MTDRGLIIIGQGPIRDLAESIAWKTRAKGTFHLCELAPNMIALTDLAFLDRYPPATADVFAAVGVHALNYARSDLWDKLSVRGYAFTSLIDPSAVVDSAARIGENCLVAEHCSVAAAAHVGRGTILLAGSRIEGGAHIDAFSWVGANSTVGSGAKIGCHTVIRPGVHIDSTVPVGAHCEIAVSGLYQSAISDGTFISLPFTEPVRIFRASR